MPKKTRKRFTSQEKVAILRLPLLEHTSVSGLCDQHGIDDLLDLAHPSQRVHRGECGEGLGRVHRRPDVARRHGVHADAPVGVFDRERPRHGVKATLGE